MILTRAVGERLKKLLVQVKGYNTNCSMDFQRWAVNRLDQTRLRGVCACDHSHSPYLLMVIVLCINGIQCDSKVMLNRFESTVCGGCINMMNNWKTYEHSILVIARSIKITNLLITCFYLCHINCSICEVMLWGMYFANESFFFFFFFFFFFNASGCKDAQACPWDANTRLT